MARSWRNFFRRTEEPDEGSAVATETRSEETSAEGTEESPEPEPEVLPAEEVEAQREGPADVEALADESIPNPARSTQFHARAGRRGGGSRALRPRRPVRRRPAGSAVCETG